VVALAKDIEVHCSNLVFLAGKCWKEEIMMYRRYLASGNGKITGLSGEFSGSNKVSCHRDFPLH
jgi:hypothetical protein